MTLKELKEKLNELPQEMENYEIMFGESTYGEKVKKIQKLGKKIYLSFI